MPVWHDLTRAWRDAGKLVLIGVALEQHPERCELFARWKGFDWPILWDPFNLRAATAVPNVIAIDEHGIVRMLRPQPGQLERDFLSRDFEAPAGTEAGGDTGREPGAAPRQLPAVHPGSGLLADILYASSDSARDVALDAGLPALHRHAQEHPSDLAARFRLGVAHRMRFDGGGRQAGDFQAALDAWSAALAGDPNQYIWRRRIQQYGPPLDKPYPFYSWVDEAMAALELAGEPLPGWPAALTSAERAEPEGRSSANRLAPTRNEQDTPNQTPAPTSPTTSPDPQGLIQRDDEQWIEVSTAVAWHTAADRRVGLVHLELRPAAGKAHWNNEAEPLRVWLDVAGGNPAGQLDSQGLGWPPVSPPVSDEVRRFEFEWRPTHAAEGESRLTGYVLFNACDEADGTCVFLRHDFKIVVDVPGP